MEYIPEESVASCWVKCNIGNLYDGLNQLLEDFIETNSNRLNYNAIYQDRTASVIVAMSAQRTFPYTPIPSPEVLYHAIMQILY